MTFYIYIPYIIRIPLYMKYIFTALPIFSKNGNIPFFSLPFMYFLYEFHHFIMFFKQIYFYII